MGHHRLYEWEARRFDATDAIPAAEAERLERVARAPAARLKGRQRAFDLRRDSLAAQNLVGVVAAGDATCEILPKVDRDASDDAVQLRRQLIGMLDVAHDLPVADDAPTTTGVQDRTLLEILIARFVRLLEDAVRRGVPRSYRERVEDLPALRGRLDPTRQFTTLAASPHRLACRYDEFSDDVPLNQVMKAAVVRLRTLARGRANQRALADLALIYADVSVVLPSSLAWHAIVPDRATARWLHLVRLARLILGDRFQNSAYGAADGFALLFDMNVLFERYVERLLEPITREAGWSQASQGGGRHCLHPEDGSDPVFATYPDIRLMRGDRVELVIDTKWKRLSDRSREPKMDVSQTDIYQVMAYAQLYRCDRLVLLYPHHGGLPPAFAVHHRVAAPDGEVRLTVATVDVAGHAAARADLRRMLGDLAAPAGSTTSRTARPLAVV